MQNRIKMSWPDVEVAFERNAPGLRSYIEKSTGQVHVVVDSDPQDAELAQRIAMDPDSFVRIDPASSQEQYRWMEQFVATLEAGELRDRLLLGIDGKGAFRRFKDLLVGYPADRDRWFNFRADLLHHHINRWLTLKGLETDPPPPWGDIEPPAPNATTLPRPTLVGENPADLLRKQVKTLVDTLAAGDLHAARVFLEYLRDRGSAELTDTRGKTDFKRPLRRPPTGGPSLFLHDDENEGRSDEAESIAAQSPTSDPSGAGPTLKIAGKL